MRYSKTDLAMRTASKPRIRRYASGLCFCTGLGFTSTGATEAQAYNAWRILIGVRSRPGYAQAKTDVAEMLEIMRQSPEADALRARVTAYEWDALGFRLRGLSANRNGGISGASYVVGAPYTIKLPADRNGQVGFTTPKGATYLWLDFDPSDALKGTDE